MNQGSLIARGSSNTPPLGEPTERSHWIEPRADVQMPRMLCGTAPKQERTEALVYSGATS